MWLQAASVVFFAGVALSVDVSSDCKYKDVSPDKGPQTVCDTEPIGSNCTGKVPFPVDQELKDQLLKTHNLIRQKLASGNVTSLPGAHLMYEMIWNDEIAEIAQRHADQCVYRHDTNRDIVVADKTVQVGQNIYMKSANYPFAFDFNDTINAWFYDELKYFNSSGLTPYVFDHLSSHLTQIAWGETKQLGCGVSNFTAPVEESNGEPWINVFVVCNYAPAGNILTGTIYDATENENEYGDKCGTVSVKYPPLCGQ